MFIATIYWIDPGRVEHKESVAAWVAVYVLHSCVGGCTR